MLFLFNARASWKAASDRFSNASAELIRLERLVPYPDAENVERMRKQVETYRDLLVRMKGALRGYLIPCPALAPSEFQSRLRVAGTTIAERARAREVRIPERFQLGFDEYASGLPNETAAPLLGQELTQIEWLASRLIDAGINSLVSFRRAPLPEEQANGLTASNEIERDLVEMTFVSTPAAAREVLNRIASADDRLLVVRWLRIRNEQQKGPPRDMVQGRGTAGSAALEFIVGDERIETTATIEIVRLRL